ncbi:hypothetical protein HK104_006070 [Borealophlyctis nickersoniae]|nr:hypothetical protein HK104_006070 [Borealophlyctis nickersoniae]
MREAWTYDLHTEDVPLDSSAVATAIILEIICVATILGCGFIGILFWKDKELRTAPNYLVLSLTFTDFLIGINRLIFISLHLSKGAWGAGYIGCQIDGFMTIVLECQSLYGLLALVFANYCAIVRQNALTMRQTGWIIAGIWGYSLFGGTLALWIPGSSRYVLQASTLLCVGHWSGTDLSDRIFTIVCLIHVSGSLNLFALAYYRINKKVRRTFSETRRNLAAGEKYLQSSTNAGASSNDKTKDKEKEDIVQAQLARKSLILVLVFVANWGLYQVNFLWEFFTTHQVPQIMDEISCGLALVKRWQASARKVLGLRPINVTPEGASKNSNTESVSFPTIHTSKPDATSMGNSKMEGPGLAYATTLCPSKTEGLGLAHAATMSNSRTEGQGLGSGVDDPT